MTLMGLVNSYSGLLAARIFLGVAEAGFFPAATFVSLIGTSKPPVFVVVLVMVAVAVVWSN